MAHQVWKKPMRGLRRSRKPNSISSKTTMLSSRYKKMKVCRRCVHILNVVVNKLRNLGHKVRWMMKITPTDSRDAYHQIWHIGTIIVRGGLKGITLTQDYSHRF
jgi:hypothetical protein